jgi:hypothetical protein
MEQCPICYSELEVRDCAPCDDCGWKPQEIEDLNDKIHTYATYDIYKGLRLTLCDFCRVDFGSYKSEYLGFKNGRRLDLTDFNFVSQIEHPQVTMDKFCPDCSARLRFLNFLLQIRLINKSEDVKADS